MRRPPPVGTLAIVGAGVAIGKEAPGVELELGEMRPPAPATIVDDSDESAINLVYESFAYSSANRLCPGPTGPGPPPGNFPTETYYVEVSAGLPVEASRELDRG